MYPFIPARIAGDKPESEQAILWNLKISKSTSSTAMEIAT